MNSDLGSDFGLRDEDEKVKVEEGRNVDFDCYRRKVEARERLTGPGIDLLVQ